MKFEILKKVINVLCILFILFSCEEKALIEKDDSIPIKSIKQENNYQIIDGTLHFHSLNDLTTLTDTLERMSDEELFNWEKTNGFHSLYHAISDAEEDIFADSILFESKLKEYNNLVYLDEDDFLTPKINSHLYQLICNENGEFYIGSYQHKVTPSEIIVSDNKSKSIERRTYNAIPTVLTKAEASPRFPLGGSSYTGNKRRVNVEVIYYRNIARNSNGNWEGQQILEIESRSGKKYWVNISNIKPSTPMMC